MFIDIEGYIPYLIKHKITPNQFLFLYLRHTLDTDTMELYMNQVKAWKREEIQDLIYREFLDDVNSPGEEYSDAYFVTPKFTQEMWIELDEAGEELWTAYATHFNIDGKRCPARTCDKEQLEKTYIKRIKNNRKKHEKIIETVKKLVTENRITMGIEKFVLSEQWEVIWETEKDGKVLDIRTSETSSEI